MEKFTIVESIAAPLNIMNIDTDMIIPKQFLKTIKRTGLGANLFHEMRFDMSGNEISDFILNKEKYKNSKILVAGDNFGCGSSREHAPWALLDFGIRVVIAPSFADIFFNNCFKNAILPIVLEQSQINDIFSYIENNDDNNIKVNLQEQLISYNGKEVKFDVDEFRKTCLIEGLDDIGLTLKKEDLINSFENNNKEKYSWLYS